MTHRPTTPLSRPRPGNFRLTACVAVAAACGLCGPVLAQWTVTSLHPAGATRSRALGVRSGQQVGFAQLPNGVSHASLWTGSAGSWVDLHPAGSNASSAYAVDGGTQVGESTASASHALVWSGTAVPSTDLHPAGASDSFARAAWGGQQGGYARQGGVYRACIWSGTPGSRVDLHPDSAGSLTSGVHAMYGGMQGGVAGSEAGIWSGSAASWVSLKPALTSDSVVWGLDATHQAGQAYFFIISQYHAVLWSGSSASFIDLNPTGSTHSAAYGVHNGVQVGYVTINNKVIASAWNGSAGTWEDLSLALTGSWSTTVARAVWSDGTTTYIVGWGTRSTTQQDEALLWTKGPCVAPQIATNPVPVQTCPDSQVSFTVTAGGTAPLTYQWVRETAPNSGTFVNLADGPTSSWDGDAPGFGAVVSGATTGTVTITPDLANGKRLGPAHALSYGCVVSNPCGNAPATPARLTVCAADYNCDGFVDGIDYDEFNNDFAVGNMAADYNRDGFVDGIDYDEFNNDFAAGC